eukprot:TRINITY_DN45339_c0_g1_i1.p1 TRINITY_DN45339_c0_g1~~TRINITY_DN45339_c0_g1_i1.p1  ORF type:complete len:219 (-),score=42.87 TRINITY_DN45339_c0_g1_i1:2-571(-)
MDAGAMDHAYAPVRELQAAYDEVLARPWRFPAHVQRLHQLAEAEKLLRQPLVDQQCVGQGKDALFLARKVVYAIVGRDAPRFHVCVTKFTCAQDFIERSANELRRRTPTSSSPAAAKRRRKGQASQGLALQGPEGLILYILESLESESIPFHRMSHKRLHHWASLLQGLHDQRIEPEEAAVAVTSPWPG